ncbi:MAG TPA: transporter substrate-binding domain-containing protein, partial [Methanocellaceae archaeon]
MLLLVTIICAVFVAFSGCTSPSATPTVAPNATATAVPNATANFTTMTPGVLSIATDASYAPFENVNTTNNNTIEGFDIDLMNQVAKELN